MTLDLTIILFSFLLSALYSASEAAFYALHRLKIEVLRKRGTPSAARVSTYLQHPERYLPTILVGNNIANVLFASFAAIVLRPFVNDSQIPFISAGVILLFGEVVPKSLAMARATQVALKLSLFVRTSEIIFLPVLRWLAAVTKLLQRQSKQNEKKHVVDLSRDDIRFLFKESRYLGQIEHKDEEIIRRVMHLNATRVWRIMRPRTEMVAVPKTTSIDELLETFARSEHSRLPVYQEDLDHIDGIIYAKDLLGAPDGIDELIKPVSFVPETKSVLALMREMRRGRSSIAIVIDEYGGTAGLVTLEDIFEEIFGEITDEYDKLEVGIKKMGAHEYDVRARTEIDVINSQLGLGIQEGDYETIAGFIISKLGRIPKQGESVDLPAGKIIVTQADRAKIIAVRIIVEK